jgi:hypothetical protein
MLTRCAHLRLVNHGAVWFLILLGAYVRWTGDLDTFQTYRANAERALEWLDRNPSRHGLEFVADATRSDKGLRNQGWKDSGDSIVNADGSSAQPSNALVEVQGYVYAAKRAIADPYRHVGETARAAALEREAADLKQRFNARFWMDEQQFYALAPQKDGRAARAASNTPDRRSSAASWLRSEPRSSVSACCGRTSSAAGVFVRWRRQCRRTFRWTTRWAPCGRTTTR